MLTKPFQVVFPDSHQVELKTEDVTPDLTRLGNEEYVLETHYSLISPGTELALYTGTHIGLSDPHNTWASYPFAPGYAAVGRVIAQGDTVPVTDSGALYFTGTGHSAHGFATLGPDKFLLPLPSGVEPEHALFCRLAAIAATALAVAPVAERGERVAVLGAGLIGNLAAQHYQVAGANVVAVETNAARLEIAQKCGLSAVLGGEGVRERLREALGGDPDLVVEATGVAALVNAALEMVRRRGRVVLLGSPRGLTEINAYKYIHSNGVILTGAHEGLHGNCGLPTRRELTQLSLDLIARNEIKVAPLLTHVLPAARVQEAYNMLIHEQNTTLGVVLDWQTGENSTSVP